MKPFRVYLPILAASGTQCYIVKAKDKAEACKIVANGGGEYSAEDSEIEVTSVDDPDPQQCEEAEDMENPNCD